ncbi:TPA: acylphosphatase [Candidatus Bipolaricaulota bacterium]|nr:acylphosphatase [Candidatus Bipolaricaulota bacterium]
MKRRVHLFISGRVQGVFFRANTCDQASRLSLTGWVRNLPDGRVEVVVEGEEAKVKELIDWCHRGPPGAQVRGVEVHWEDYRGEFSGFEIRY